MIENYMTLRCYNCPTKFKNKQEKKECIERIHPNDFNRLSIYATLVEKNYDLYPVLCSY